ncbi:MAG: G8 domain-containing protein [Prosthecobacter sp.]|uniref:G8 domain-containing protein n=1 Tax=Prosthecobacter sp. TaxID=1965333 RepID=UPI003901927D
MNLQILLCLLLLVSAVTAADPVIFNARSASSGRWSDASTWEGGRLPQAGDFVQVRAGHRITYDVHSPAALRMLHVAGGLTFSREKSTLLEVGLIKVEPGESTTEDGFNCHDAAPVANVGAARPLLEIGSIEQPIPAGVTATIRLRHFAGTNPETLPAITVCGGHWEVHGAPLSRTWVKLAAPAKAGDASVQLQQGVTGWRVGDRVIITSGQMHGSGHTFRQDAKNPKPAGTEERIITAMHEAGITLDRPLQHPHHGEGIMRCEVANLSRNVVVESANPAGVRGHTMYHRDSSGGISYAEFRHLGKDGVLGKYAIHFHLVRDTMRGSGVTGASIWDSHNRWITIHGTDHLLIRDCVGYQSRGHGFFLEDATEQWNVLDRNLAVQAFVTKKLPQQVLPFDPNDGAGFWWANGRNTFTRNVSCENDRYGYHFELAKTSNFNPVLRLREPDGTTAARDVRTLPFLRFEDNESHSEGLYSFNFGDDENGSVHGDRTHPFIAKNLRAWEAHYVVRPDLQFFLLDGLRVKNAVYGVYHPDYDAHVYRDLDFDNVNSEPVNRGHDDESIQFGDFTYERLTLANCRVGRDPLIQLACTAPKAGVSGHFKDLVMTNSQSRGGSVVDLGGGPRSETLEHPVSYYFHDTSGTTRVVSMQFPDAMKDADYRSVDGFTGSAVRAAKVKPIAFPQLLAPVDDLPPATLITSIRHDGKRSIIRGVSHDNGEVASITVNGTVARIITQQAGVADWEATLATPANGCFKAQAADQAGNAELLPHEVNQAVR